MYIYLFPFGFQYTFTTLPQLGHFSDTMIHPEPVSPISQARFLHRLSGHFIFRIIPPPFPQYICCYLPTLIWNKGTSLSLPVPFSHLCIIGFLFLKILLISPGSPQIQKFIRLRGISCKIIPVYPMCCLIQTTFSQIYYRFW